MNERGRRETKGKRRRRRRFKRNMASVGGGYLQEDSTDAQLRVNAKGTRQLRLV